MKTIEEKAKAYDELTAKLKEWHNGLQDGSPAKETLEYLLPQFRASEDERIRKELINEICCLRAPEEKGSDRYESLTKMITYLEKQKEQKQETISISEMVSKYRTTDEYDVDGNWIGKPVNCMIRAYEQGIRDTLSKVKEQKPAWSEEEKHRKWILEYLYDGLRKADEQFKDHFKSAIDWLEKQKELFE